ncbi:MAG TPA: hypothetical protein VFB33_10200 [Candidatus Binataceae bacterium]|jgi:hypothetical protein|nr:hypothetical protein [Candidatus Binataceae bacterium]
MWLRLTEQATGATVWANSDLVTHVFDSPKGASVGCKLVFTNSNELAVREVIDWVMAHLTETSISSATMT